MSHKTIKNDTKSIQETLRGPYIMILDNLKGCDQTDVACSNVGKILADYSSLYIGGARPLRMAGHRQVISRIGRGSQNILIYNFIIATVGFQGSSPGEMLWHALVWRSHLAYNKPFAVELKIAWGVCRLGGI